MTGFFSAISASLVLLMLMAVGYGMGAAGWMSAQEKRFISKFLINIAVPCNCLVGLLNNLDRGSLAQAGIMVVSGLLGVGTMVVISMAAATLLKLPRERWGVFVAMAGLSNALFIGIPVCTQLFGEACIPYVMVYYLANTSYTQTAGILLVERAGMAGGTKMTFLGFLKDLFTKPPIVAVLGSVLLLLMGLRPPDLIMRFAGYISNSISPLALIYSGFIIYEVGLRNLRLLRGLPSMLVLRLGAAPLVCLACCRIFGVEGLARSVFVVESALPVVTQVAVMAGAFGADEQYAATGACLSTLGGMVTIPILMLLLG